VPRVPPVPGSGILERSNADEVALRVIPLQTVVSSSLIAGQKSALRTAMHTASAGSNAKNWLF
jgi:hypothetical protein